MTILDSPQQIWQHCQFLRNKKQEYSLAFFLNRQYELIHQVVLSIGGLNFNFLDLRELFETAFNCRASFLVLVHNHPSGSADASFEDLLASHKLAKLGETLSLPLLDHLIITKKNYFSIRQHYGKLSQLKLKTA